VTVSHLAAHRVTADDTLEKIVASYGLSSVAALTEIPANTPLKAVFEDRQGLREGLLIYIPPPAMRLARDRLYLMHAVRPLFQAHFDDLRSLVETTLLAEIGAWRETGSDEGLLATLGALQQRVNLAVETTAARTWPIVANCRGMMLTHVAEPADHAVVGASDDPLCGLYWTVTPPFLNQWQIFWEAAGCLKRWAFGSADEAMALAERNLNTLSSLIMQQVDQRIRGAQALEARLRQERAG